MDQKYESLDSIADHTARMLVETASGHAFALFRKRDFRHLAGFDHLSEGEHDRIFNELVAAFVILEMLMLEAPDLRVAKEFAPYVRMLGKKIPSEFANNLASVGVEPPHIETWKKLLDLRYTEYSRDKHEVRRAAMQLESSHDSLNERTLEIIQLLVPLQSVAIGCHDHICRGKTEGKDDLLRLILRELSKFYGMLRVRLEGRKIGPLTHLKAKLRSWLR